MINLWINAFLKPKETFAAEKNNASFGKAILNLFVAGVIAGVLGAIISLIFSIFFPIFAFSAVIYLLAYPILLPIGEIITVAIIFVLAKLLGGTGSFKSLLYTFSLFSPALALLGSIPLVSFIAGLYGLYLYFLAVKESQNLSTGRALLATFIIPILVLIIIVIGVASLVFLINPSDVGASQGCTGFSTLPITNFRFSQNGLDITLTNQTGRTLTNLQYSAQFDKKGAFAAEKGGENSGITKTAQVSANSLSENSEATVRLYPENGLNPGYTDVDLTLTYFDSDIGFTRTAYAACRGTVK